MPKPATVTRPRYRPWLLGCVRFGGRGAKSRRGCGTTPNCRTDGTGKIEAYAYDLADRLNTGTVGSACTGGSTSYTKTYGLNAADFISSKSGEPTTSNNWAATSSGMVNAIGTLTPTSGTGRAYSYDANGNVLNNGANSYT